MTRSEKLAMFWMGTPELPNEIKGLICKEFWNDQKLIKESQEMYFRCCVIRKEPVFISSATMVWWGSPTHAELSEMFQNSKYKGLGEYLEVVDFNDGHEDLLIIRKKYRGELSMLELIDKIAKTKALLQKANNERTG